MSHEIRPDYQQIWMFPPTLEEWVPKDHPARFIRGFVDSLELESLGIQGRESEEGRPNYAPDLLLKVWLYGYFEGIRSSRGLERACYNHLGMVWLAGRHTPDHNTLWRFFQRHRKAMKQVFVQSVKVALDAELVGMALHALDGTKIEARCSRRTARHRKDLERELRQLEAAAEQALRETEAAEQQDQGTEGEYRLPPELKDREQLEARIRKALQELEEAGTDHQNPSEPEARMMQCEGRVKFAYNAQAVVDGESGLIVAQEVVTEAADNALLVPMLEQAEEALGQTAAETVADGGYQSGEQLAQAEVRRYEVLVNLEGGQPAAHQMGPFDGRRFVHHAERDCCICPLGQELSFERIKSNRRKSFAVRVYRCGVYRDCPQRWACSRDPQGRSIEIGPHHAVLVRHREKLRRPEQRELLRQRMRIAEPAFARLKQVMGFRRWTIWGLEGVRGQASLLWTAANLRKLHKHWRTGRLALVPG